MTIGSITHLSNTFPSSYVWLCSDVWIYSGKVKSVQTHLWTSVSLSPTGCPQQFGAKMNLLAYFEPTAFVTVDIYYLAADIYDLVADIYDLVADIYDLVADIYDLVADIYDPVAACGYILSSGLPSIYVMLKF